MDKSRSTQIIETENTVNKENKSRSNSPTSLYVKSTKIEKPSETDISKDNLSISFLSGHGEILSSVTSDQQCITRKNKRNKTSDTLITGKESIQESVNTSKRAKEVTIPDVEKSSPKETPPTFKNKVDYIVDTIEKTHGSDDSPSETGGCEINLSG